MDYFQPSEPIPGLPALFMDYSQTFRTYPWVTSVVYGLFSDVQNVSLGYQCCLWIILRSSERIPGLRVVYGLFSDVQNVSPGYQCCLWIILRRSECIPGLPVLFMDYSQTFRSYPRVTSVVYGLFSDVQNVSLGYQRCLWIIFRRSEHIPGLPALLMDYSQTFRTYPRVTSVVYRLFSDVQNVSLGYQRCLWIILRHSERILGLPVLFMDYFQTFRTYPWVTSVVYGLFSDIQNVSLGYQHCLWIILRRSERIPGLPVLLMDYFQTFRTYPWVTSVVYGLFPDVQNVSLGYRCCLWIISRCSERIPGLPVLFMDYFQTFRTYPRVTGVVYGLFPDVQNVSLGYRRCLWIISRRSEHIPGLPVLLMDYSQTFRTYPRVTSVVYGLFSDVQNVSLGYQCCLGIILRRSERIPGLPVLFRDYSQTFRTYPWVTSVVYGLFPDVQNVSLGYQHCLWIIFQTFRKYPWVTSVVYGLFPDVQNVSPGYQCCLWIISRRSEHIPGLPVLLMDYFQTFRTYPWVTSVAYMDKELCKLVVVVRNLVKDIY